MDTNQPSAYQYLVNSQKAFEKGDLTGARRWARLAVNQAPDNEEAWLWMGAIASPQASVGYLRRALEINPASTRARQGLAWAQKRIAAGQMAETRPIRVHRVVPASLTSESRPASNLPANAPTAPAKTVVLRRTPAEDASGRPDPVLPPVTPAAVPARRAVKPATPSLLSALRGTPRILTSAAVLAFLCLALAAAALLNTSDARATLLGAASPSLSAPTALADAQAPDASPTQPAAPAEASETASPLPQASATSNPTQTPAPSATAVTATAAAPTPLPTDTAAPTQKPAPTSAPVSQPAGSTNPAPAQAGTSGGGQKIVVSISKQHMWVYEGETLVYSFVVSTGLHNSTAIGNFSVLDKIPNAYGSTWDLWMPDWMGIYQAGTLENGIHALPILSNGQTLWAGLLGQPASFGCIILGTADAQTLYNWAQVGTPVIIQP